MAHPHEPPLKELKLIIKELWAAESTNENMKKILAVEAQIARRVREELEAGKMEV